ncbi:hypothetical protein S245_060677, partial [Arachis hypogaea]
MFHSKHHSLTRALLFFLIHTPPLPSPSIKSYLLLLPQTRRHSYLFSTTCTSGDHHSFTVSYLTTKCGFSHEDALRANKRVRFDTPVKPDSVISFFKAHGFSLSQITTIICRFPVFLTCDPANAILPKFQFLASKGASPSDIVLMTTRSSRFLLRSLDHIVSLYELVRRFCPSDLKAIAYITAWPSSIADDRVAQNVKLLLDEGLTNANIHHLLRTRPSVLSSADLKKTVEEVKQLGFDPSHSYFSVVLLTKRAITKSKWEAKVDVLKKWGWSEQDFSEAFRRHPNFMLRSEDKLNAVMSFWISNLGWDSSALRIRPMLFGCSLEKRLIPRAKVVKYLLSNGLMKKNASIITPFSLTEELFLKKCVTCFEEKDRSRLLTLYQGGCFASNLQLAIFIIMSPPHDYSQQLYDKYKEVFEEYIQSTGLMENLYHADIGLMVVLRVLPSLREKHDEFMLRELVKRWANHKIMVRWLCCFFHYLDRYFVARRSLPPLNEVGLTCFRDRIDQEREGEQIDRALLKNVLDIFVEIGMGQMDHYENDFEFAMLKDTSAYYSQKASNWILEDSCPDYTLKVECLKQEKDRVAHYLHSSSEPKLLEKVQHELLSVCANQLLQKEHSGCHALLRDDNVEDLSRMFRLFSKIPEGLDPVSSIFKQDVITEGMVLVKQAEDAASIPKGSVTELVIFWFCLLLVEFILSIACFPYPVKCKSVQLDFVWKMIELHDKYLAYVNDCFQNHTIFHK